jgi:hypothetical protein
VAHAEYKGDGCQCNSHCLQLGYKMGGGGGGGRTDTKSYVGVIPAVYQ